MRRWAVTGAISLTSLSAAFAQTSYFITELPAPLGYDTTVPYQINDQGFVVGASSSASLGQVATVWKGGVVQVLGRLNHGTYSIANAINSKGVIAGEGDDGDGRPLGWVTSAGKLVNFFSNNGGNTHPIAINDAGDIGGYFIKGFDSTWHAGIWKIDPKDPRKSTLITLPILPSADPNSSAIAFAFNKTNQAAGWAANATIGQHAAFWQSDAAHTIVDLGVFGSDWSSIANSLNDLGQVVGESHPPFGSRPVLWQNDATHTAVELPLLPGDNYGSASLVNSTGTIIGWSATSEPGTWNVGPSRIVIWVGGAPYDLQSLIVQPSGWTINQVMSINNLGQMAALATRNGVSRAVVLNPL